MNFKKLATGAALTLGGALLSSPAAYADVILTYTGNSFTSVSPPYTTTDKVMASILVANPLGDNLNLVHVTPLEFTLSVARQTIVNGEGPFISTVFTFSTNASGDIIAWDVDAAVPAQGAEIATVNVPGDVTDFAATDIDFGSASNANTSGTWTAAPTPAPPPSNLAALGMLGLAFFWRRRRQLLGWLSKLSNPDRHQRIQRAK